MNNFSTTEEFFETPIQQFQFFDKYSRYRHDLKRRESWPETVDRVVKYLKKLSNYSLDNHVYKRIHQNILDLNVMPSMRLVAMAGPAADRTNVAIYNCSFMGINNIKAFAEALLISMSGCGVGFSVEHKYINELPELPEYLFNYDNTVVNEKPFIIEDSTEGWFDAINYLFNSLYYKNIIPGFDYSKIRPAGSVLVTKGGRASGPEPLRDCIGFIIDTFKLAIENKQNRLSSLQVHDIMCSIGQAAVSGGVRRTAMLSMFDKNDNDMLTCKTGGYNNYRWNANNTIVLDEDTTRKEYDVVMDSLFDGMAGEPGIFFEASNKHTAPSRRNHSLIAGMNPCGEIKLRDMQYCVSGETLIITENGIDKIKNLVDTAANIWNGKSWSTVYPFQTGKNQELYRVYFSDGSFLDCTKYHRFSIKSLNNKEYQECTLDDIIHRIDKFTKTRIHSEPYRINHTNGYNIQSAYTIGFGFGDGCVYNNTLIIDLYGEKDFKCPVDGKRGKIRRRPGYNTDVCRLVNHDEGVIQTVAKLKYDEDVFSAWKEIFTWDRESILKFIAGLADSDGSKTNKNAIRIYISSYEKASYIQLLLTKCGIKSSISLQYKAGTNTNYGIRKKNLYYITITDCAEIPCHRVDTSSGKFPIARGKYQIIKSIEKLEGLFDTFCLEEVSEHKCVFNNVLTYQCNLSSVICRNDDTLETLTKKVEVATIIGTIQSMATHFPGLRPEWKNNCEEERLLGVDLNGQLDCPILNRSGYIRDYLKTVAIAVNKQYARALGINQSVAITCVN